MQVFNWKENRMDEERNCVRGIVKIHNEVCEYGYFTRGYYILVYHEGDIMPLFDNSLLKYCFFDGRIGHYVLQSPFTTGKKDRNLKMGRGSFPYSFRQQYEAIHSFDIFNGKQYLKSKEEKFKYGDLLKYTFGLEFETSSGYIPEDVCLRDGLIPLRDGSISGVEYSTTVLKGNTGLNYLKQQIDTLNKYTIFDKECSLHVHMGVSSVSVPFVWNLYVLLTIFQEDLKKFVPEWTFESEKYKRTGKNYCKKIPVAATFDKWYKYIAGGNFDGSLKIPHPADPERTHKWQVHSRYFAFNFVNLMCYESPKTLEFRFLRPTYNFCEIYTWLFVFNALISVSVRLAKSIGTKNYDETVPIIKEKYGDEDITYYILKDYYPKELADDLIYKLKMIMNAHTIMRKKGDYYGASLDLKEDFYKWSNFNTYGY